MSAPLVKTLAPFTMYSSPSRTARVRSEARSVPASGSVYPMAKLTSPARMAGRKKDFWSSLPAVLLRPPDAQPAVLADALHDLAPQFAALADFPDPLPHIVGEQLGVVGAQLLAQGQLLGGLLQEHGAVRLTGPGRRLPVP